MNKEALLKYLQEEEQKIFLGWDFSYLDGRLEEGILPWDYKEMVLKYLDPRFQLLDIGTGGGEFLLTLQSGISNFRIT